MVNYEVMFIIDPALEDEKKDAAVERVKSVITSEGEVAIEDSLSRATKFKNDNINQEVRSLMLGEKRIVNTSYDEPVKLDELELTVTYLDGRKEIVAFEA